MSTRSSPLAWLPVVEDFPAALAAALAQPAGAMRSAALVALASSRLDNVSTRELDAAVRKHATAPEGWNHVRVALLGDARMDPFAPALRVAGLRYRLWLEVYAGSYGQIAQALLAPDAALADFRPDVVLLATRPDGAFVRLSLDANEAEVDACIGAWVDEQAVLSRRARELFGAWTIHETAVDLAPSLFGSFETAVPAAPATRVARCNAALQQRARRDGGVVLDAAAEARRLGRDRWFDATYWYQARQRVAPAAVPLYGDLVARLVAARLGRGRKCVAVDLDDTLWGGTVGEDGAAALTLAEGDPAGEAFRDFQGYLKQLAQRGVLLALCSKNDEATALAVLREHPEMVLREADVAAVAVNWNDKATNLRNIAATLNLGLDAIVFVDNDPYERALVRRLLPEVAVPELPAECSGFAACIAAAGYFEALAFTPEDRQRGAHFAADRARATARGGAASLDDFLAELAMELKVAPFREVDLPRVGQLVGRTNQFNLSGRRHDERRLGELARTPGALTLQGRLTDRLGDSGLVTAAIVLPTPDAAVLRLDTWVMSCRVFGRGVEHAVYNQLVARARAAGASRIVADYVPTPRNGLVADSLAAFGFVRTGSGDGWMLDLDAAATASTAVRVTSASGADALAR